MLSRLKISLNLPPIEPRPPVPPRIYKRLYGHLDKILPASSTPGHLTPSSKRRGPGNLPGGRPLPSRLTPSKETSLAQFRNTPKNGGGSTPLKLGRSSSTQTSKGPDKMYAWIWPTLRFLCTELGKPQFAASIMTAMEEIVTPQGRRTTDTWVENNTVSLLGALYMYVWRSASMPSEGFDQGMYVNARKQVVDTLKQSRKAVRIQDGDKEGAWEGWHNVLTKDLDSAALWINRHGWLESSWAQGLASLAREDDAEQGPDGDNEASNDQPSRVTRADTMFQDRVDFLTERRIQEYAVWKDEILRRLVDLEQRPGDGMDIDS